MSSVNTVPNNLYYQLSNLSAGPGGTGIASTTPTLSDALLQAMAPSPSPSPGSFDSNAYMLNLSPQALQILGSSGTGTGDSGLGSLLGDSGSNPLGIPSSFTLTAAQQQQISAILAKYKDAPYSQDTFNQIQSDLTAAGLGPNQLSMEDQIKSFNPAQVLIDALGGTASDTLSFSGSTPADEQSKSTTYMQRIMTQWQQISTTYAAAKSSDSSAVGGTAGA